MQTVYFFCVSTFTDVCAVHVCPSVVVFFMWRNCVQQRLIYVQNMLHLSTRAPLALSCITAAGTCYTPVQRSALHTCFPETCLDSEAPSAFLHVAPRTHVTSFTQALTCFVQILSDVPTSATARVRKKRPSSTGFPLKMSPLFLLFFRSHLCWLPLLAPPQLPVFAPPPPFFLSFCSCHPVPLSHTVLN